MDVNSLIGNKKQKKHHAIEAEDEIENNIRICDLPDPILSLIISSLPTKEAVRTSLLSKRWPYLWRDISKIELKEGEQEERQQFANFVKTLLLVFDCSNIKRFFLSFKAVDQVEYATQVTRWLRGFINPEIEELNFDLK